MIDDTPVQEQEVQEITEETLVQETQEVKPEAPAPIPQPPQESDAQKSFRELRDQKLRLERERDEALRKLKEAEAKAASEEIMVGDDDIVEGKHLTKTNKKIKQLEEELKNYQQQASMLSVESRIKSKYPDFDKVVTIDNIEKFKTKYPSLASTLDATPDLFTKADAAYELIQKFGINESDPYMEDKQKAQLNASKPRPTASLSPQQGGSPLEKANAFAGGLTDELKAQLHKEMMESMRNR
jgi:vacuolar-type H+-ATPase subunit I/STV1